jgi:hypothetical protein
MIEVPHEFLNVLFMLLIASAGVKRLRQRSDRKGTLTPLSVYR